MASKDLVTSSFVISSKASEVCLVPPSISRDEVKARGSNILAFLVQETPEVSLVALSAEVVALAKLCLEAAPEICLVCSSQELAERSCLLSSAEAPDICLVLSSKDVTPAPEDIMREGALARRGVMESGSGTIPKTVPVGTRPGRAPSESSSSSS